MLGDSSSDYPANNLLIHVYVPDVDDVFRRALAAGGTEDQAPQQQAGDPDRRGSFKDVAGNTWAVATQNRWIDVRAAPPPGGLTRSSWPCGGWGCRTRPSTRRARSPWRERDQSETPGKSAWPLAAWPKVPTRFLLARDDRLFPAEWMRRVVKERLGITPDEIDGGHCVALSRPKELADRLERYLTER